MRFLRENAGQAERAIARKICDELFAGKRVLWLTSGGSNVPIEVAVMKLVKDHCGDKLTGLAILPMDERYGPSGHANSNAQALRDADFGPGDATWVDVLMHDVPLDQTVSFYNDVAAAAFANAGCIVAQFGLGDNGHVAGIQPESPATAPGEASVVGYEWSDYIRLTLTAELLRQITTGFVVAYGPAKQTALERLQANTETYSALPAKLLYEIPDVYVYNDHIESEG